MARTKKTRLRSWPVIRRLELKTKTVWVVDTGSVIEPRIRKKFESSEQAETYAERLRTERHNEGVAAFTLSPAEKEDARLAMDQLRALNVSLLDAAKFFRLHHRAPADSKSAREVFEEMIAYKRDQQKARPRYIRDLKARLHGFLQAFGDRKIHEIGPDEIKEWLFSDTEISELTRDNIHRNASVLFAYAQGKRGRRHPPGHVYRVDNPMSAVPKPVFQLEPPKILSVAQAKSLLRAAHESQEKHGMLPYIVLGLFAGIRAEELKGLTWADVQIARKQVTVPARIAKKRRLRNIPLGPAALSWLAPFKKAEGPISPKRSERLLAKVGMLAGISEWPTNALRHSYGSYLFALTEDAQLTSARLGQKGDEVLFTHYRALAGMPEAKAYFQLSKTRVVTK
jgi:Site-specific recombinase XerD